jgi:hypothetical protein
MKADVGYGIELVSDLAEERTFGVEVDANDVETSHA